MVITKEQEAELDKKFRELKTDEYICNECNQRVIGDKGIENHILNNHHYTYKHVKTGGDIAIL